MDAPQWLKSRCVGWGGRTESSVDNRFYQLTAGFDAVHPDWDFRVNGHAALRDPRMLPGLAHVRLPSSRIPMEGNEEIALSGVCLEVSARVPLERFLGVSRRISSGCTLVASTLMTTMHYKTSRVPRYWWLGASTT